MKKLELTDPLAGAHQDSAGVELYLNISKRTFRKLPDREPEAKLKVTRLKCDT